MKTTIEVDIAPFKVPDKVAIKGSKMLKGEGFIENRALHLKELDEETLDTLCKEFRAAVFTKAGY